jgi:hypothetical protein
MEQNMKNCMKHVVNKTTTLALAAAACCLPVIPAQAHHSFSMFDRDTQMVLTGKVERWAFNNPHAWLYLNVTGDNGEAVTWGFEGGAPPQLVRVGITGRSFEPGDDVTIMFSPLADGRPGGAICWVKAADGQYLKPADGGCGAREPDSVERWERWLEMGITSNKDPRAK